MLNIRNVKHLASITGFTVLDLRNLCENTGQFCEELVLIDPQKPPERRRRPVILVTGDLRRFQDRFLRSLLIPKLTPSPHAHGGICGRSIKTNIEKHVEGNFAYTTDISSFYPSIRRDRVYRLFMRLGCTPDVARICTRLCTYRYHLALGLVTSPFLADQVFNPIDKQIARACESFGSRSDLIYTRFVDDITISAKVDLSKSGIRNLTEKILRVHGFKAHPAKSACGTLSGGIEITKLVVKGRRADVRDSYLKELNRQLDDAMNLANGLEFQGPYYTYPMISGRVQFACWINPAHKFELRQKLRSVPWRLVAKNAAEKGLIVARKQVVRNHVAAQILS